jgi:hypothetical protein
MESIYIEVRKTTLDICKVLSHEINLVVVPIEIFIFLVFLAKKEAKNILNEKLIFKFGTLIDEFAKELDYDSPSQISTVWEIEKLRMSQYSSIPNDEENRDQMVALIFCSILAEALSGGKFIFKNDAVGVGMGDGLSTVELGVVFDAYTKEIQPIQEKMIGKIKTILSQSNFK